MGTWATPNTPAKAREVADLLARPLSASRADRALYDIVGDDRLFDEIAECGATDDVRVLVARKLKEWDESYHKHPDSWFVEFSPATWEVLRRAYKKILARSGRRS